MSTNTREPSATAGELDAARLRELARRFIEAADMRAMDLVGHDVRLSKSGHRDPYFDSYHDARMPLAIALDDAAALSAQPHGSDDRNPICVERWPECETFAYDPRCCRFPKSCSAGRPAQPHGRPESERLHRPVPVEMIDWEASSAANDEVLVNVMVCRECFALAYPAGDSDGEDYAPEVIWPCATACESAAPAPDSEERPESERPLLLGHACHEDCADPCPFAAPDSEERVRLRDEYIAFLNEANEGALGMAHVHGWRCSEANVHKGIRLRAAIEAADHAAALTRPDTEGIND